MWLADVSLVVRHLYLVLITTLMMLMVVTQKEVVAEEISKRRSIDIPSQTNKNNALTAPTQNQQLWLTTQYRCDMLQY